MNDRSVIEIKDAAAKEIAESGTLQALEAVRVKYVGRKGILTGVLRSISTLEDSQRALVGKTANEVKGILGGLIAERARTLEEVSPEKKAGALDISLPGVRQWIGRKHLISLVTEELKGIFTGRLFRPAITK